MKHARIRYQGQVHQVTVEDANAVRLADGTLLTEDRVEWLPPATGSMFALGLNYADHAAELSFKRPANRWRSSSRRAPTPATARSAGVRTTSTTCTTSANWWR